MQEANLLPFAFAVGEAVLTVAIGTIFLPSGAGEEGFVLLGVNLVLRVTAHAERIDVGPWIHNIGRRAVFSPGPGFVGNVGVTIPVAIRAADVGVRMDKGNFLLQVVYVANVAATVICSRPGRRGDVGFIIKQQ